MSFQCKIAGHTTWGSGLSTYTVYKIDVMRLGKSWSIYRRYTAFVSLHLILAQEFGGPKLVELKMAIPEKDLLANMPDILSATIMQQREAALDSYLQIMSQQTGWGDKCAGIGTFLDFFGMGASGITTELGANRVIKQMYCQTKYASNTLLDYWKMSYVALTRDGNIYVMKTMYDKTAGANPRVDLKASNVQISAKYMTRFIVDIAISSFDSTMHLQIKLMSNEEYLSWVRAASDLNTITDRVDSTRSTMPSQGSNKSFSASASSFMGGVSKSFSGGSAPAAASTSTNSQETEQTDNMSANWGI